MSERKVEIDLDARGRGSLKVDGIDLSTLVGGVSFDVAAGGIAQVSVQLRAMALQARVTTEQLELVRTMLIEQNDCICAEILPELGHQGGLDIDPDCPQHGKAPS